MDDMPDVNDSPTGRIDYASSNPFEVHHLIHGIEKASPQEVFGWLLMPEENARTPLPCIVACHGSLGWRGHHHEHIARWLEAGFAVFRVHSFDARQVQSIVEDQMSVTHAMLTRDAFQALRFLSRHPLIDASRIAVTGWSLGGTVSLYSAWLPIAEALAPDGERFAAHLPFYPGAHLRMQEARWSQAPIRVLHGEKDDYTPVSFVRDLADAVAAQGIQIDITSYPGAHHSFDAVEGLTWLPEAIRLGRSVVEIDLKGDMWSVSPSGRRHPMNEAGDRKAAFRAASNVGAHIGGQWEARRRSFSDATEFFQAALA
ncbi:MAG: dienelactone hydrolase family protein [Myxococcota bacterium]|nr:dienelactone hydrolase family protein [Myxococcota bacterium]